MASSASFSSSSGSSPHHRSRFGDTTYTKVFVGGLAWETPTEELQKYFDKFGEILEAVIITDKNTGRSKGYGFVTFRDPEAARRSVAEPNPVIDGRRANCNIAALGRPRPSPPRGRSQSGSIYQSPPQPMGPPQYTRLPAQMPPSPPPPLIYQTPYGYLTYPAEFGYQQQAMYSPQMASPYYQQMYGPTSPPNVGPPSPYHFGHFGYPMQSPRGSFPSQSQAPRQIFLQYPAAPNLEGSFTSSSSPPFVQLQLPPHARQPVTSAAAAATTTTTTITVDSPAPQQPSTSGGNTDQSPTTS